MAIVTNPEGAVPHIQSGFCIGLGGSVNAGHPMALIRALIRARIEDLCVTGLTSGLDADMLVAAGLVTRLSAAYVGAEDIVGLPPAIRWAAETGTIEVWETEEGIHLASLDAYAKGKPYNTWTGALGTCCMSHPLVDPAEDELTGARYLKVRPLKVDVALLWAEAADEEGNIRLWGSDFGDEALHAAADLRIVQVERLVSTRTLEREPDRLVPWAADIVVVAPLSTHPFGSSALGVDVDWLRSYDDAVRKSRESEDRRILDRFLEEWFYRDGGEDAYLAQVGMSRLRKLLR